MTQNELYHYGILGQKWGVRRYQNPDGSLTSAGKKKYGTKTNFEKVQAAKKRAEKKATIDKARQKANARTQAEIDKYNKITTSKLKKLSKNSSESSDTKSIKDMTDDEIRAKISRIRLENELKSLTPQQISRGKNITTTILNDVIAPAAKNAGKQFVEKKMKEMLGLDDKDVKDTSKELQKMAQEYENRKKIDEGQKYFKEGKYKETKETKSEKAAKEDNKQKVKTDNKNSKEKSDYTEKENNSNKRDRNSSKKETKEDKKVYTGTVEGKGTSKYRKPEPEVVDGVWREVTPNSPIIREYTQIGSSYVNQFLLEDKRRNS